MKLTSLLVHFTKNIELLCQWKFRVGFTGTLTGESSHEMLLGWIRLVGTKKFAMLQVS